MGTKETDLLHIGPVPAEEDCAQLGQDPDFAKKNIAECERFIAQIRRHYGDEPEGAKVKMKSNLHDFGTYREVVVQYEVGNAAAENYAFDIESDKLGKLARWDD